jgi:hypothetical protein
MAHLGHRDMLSLRNCLLVLVAVTAVATIAAVGRSAKLQGIGGE